MDRFVCKISTMIFASALSVAVVNGQNSAAADPFADMPNPFAGESDATVDDLTGGAKSGAMADFEAGSSRMMADYNRSREEINRQHEEFRDETMRMWGDSTAVEGTNKSWVEYDEEKSARSIVDFEKGEMKVEVLLTPEELAADPDIAEKKLKKALSDAMASPGRSPETGKSVGSSSLLDSQIDLSGYGIDLDLLFKMRPKNMANAPTPQGVGGTLAGRDKKRTPVPAPSVPNGTLAGRGEEPQAPKLPFIEEQIAPQPFIEESNSPLAKYEESNAPLPTINDTPLPTIKDESLPAIPVEQETKESKIEEDGALSYVKEDLPEITQSIVEKSDYKITEVVGEDGEKKIVASIDLSLVKDHLSKRASEYEKVVERQSERFSIDTPVLFAVMEQESAFNPVAQSWVPAYGLMQLVPTSGGLDAYQYVYNEKKIVSGDYLFVPENNVELGAAYLKILKTRYFHKVTDARSQLLCMIAAYNCGAGNVSRAMTGNTNISKAIPYINKLTYDELYDHFRAKLPKETQDYVYKITRNIDKYTATSSLNK